MKIELKNVKYAAFASQETPCFNAGVYIDGVKAGTVENDGHGGSDMFFPHTLQVTLDAYAKTLPPRVHEDVTYPQDAETIISDLFCAWEVARENKRLCAKKVCFRKPGEQYREGEYHTLKGSWKDHWPHIKDFLVKKYGPDVYILNEHV